LRRRRLDIGKKKVSLETYPIDPTFSGIFLSGSNREGYSNIATGDDSAFCDREPVIVH
jgi:hypothetical protein